MLNQNLSGGQYVGRQATVHPRDIIVKLVKNAGADPDREKLFRAFREAIDGDDDLQRPVDWYFFINMFEYLTTTRNRGGRVSKAEIQAREKEEQSKAKFIAEKIILLNQEMPNGKRLRFCTLDYLYRLGGVYKAAGKKGSQKRVGEIYSEEQFRSKMKGIVG